MIGSAWLFGPLYAAKIAGSSAIISWLLGGIATTLIALTFSELSTLLPIAGGMTRFTQLTHGTLTKAHRELGHRDEKRVAAARCRSFYVHGRAA
ncbi:MAG: hypothetical protein ACLP2U_09535 [Syntrophobacteraceae bacterium]